MKMQRLSRTTRAILIPYAAQPHPISLIQPRTTTWCAKRHNSIAHPSPNTFTFVF